MELNEHINYWISLAENDLSVMEHLFSSKDFSYSLFIGDLALEKILKALYVKQIQKSPPRTHDLFKLATALTIKFDDELLKYLIIVNTFNIEARYPDEKLSFYKKCTSEFTTTNISKIKELYLWLKSQI